MIAVIDVTGNNLASLTNALEKLGRPWCLTHCKDTIKSASHVLLPGVGTARFAMDALMQHDLVETLQNLTQPLLGICVGMQLLYEKSAEGDVACLNILKGSIQKLPMKAGFSIPHMGWNRLYWEKESPLAQGLKDREYVYFVHSYAALNPEYRVARCEYSEGFSAIVQKDNVVGMQFHPEKSANAGLILLNNFLTFDPQVFYI